MTAEANKALARRIYDEVINGRNLDLLDEIVSPDFVEHESIPGLPSTGPEAPKAALGMFLAAFTDFRMTPEDMIAEGDKVAVRLTMSGTHTGELMGIPPTNKSFTVQGIDILQVRDGRGVAHWGVTDMSALMQQLGLAPEM
ncbi:MAG TPA: ester cyclase [Gemmatimonadales bacterium]|nr:ester cyclase [Gemmatimonadales bacterium]